MASELELIEKLRAGDEEAFSHFYEKYSAILLSHLFYMLGNKEAAEEILHEVFMTILNKINYYQDDHLLKNSFKAWIFRIATNRAIDEIRKNKKIKFEIIEIADESETEIEYENKWRDHKIQELLSRLPLGQRTFLNLKINNDLSHLEIARICSCQVNAVKQGLFQARKSLKNMLLREEVEL